MNKITGLQRFKNDCSPLYNNKYDYSKVIYFDYMHVVKIKCPIHGYFWETPYNHRRMKGCPKCEGRHLTKRDFVKQSIEIHGKLYDYSKVRIKKGIKMPVEIICPMHGVFLQTPERHLLGKKCIFCANGKKVDEKDAKLKAKELSLEFPTASAKELAEIWKQRWKEGKIDKIYPINPHAFYKKNNRKKHKKKNLSPN